MIVFLQPAHWQLWPICEYSWTWRRYLYRIYIGPLVIQFREPQSNARY